MGKAIAEPDSFQRIGGLSFICDAVEILRQHDVFQRAEIRHEMELLEDESDFLRAVADQIVFTELRQIDIIHNHVPDVSVSSPPRILISVVLPLPEGPINATHSPD